MVQMTELDPKPFNSTIAGHTPGMATQDHI